MPVGEFMGLGYFILPPLKLRCSGNFVCLVDLLIREIFGPAYAYLALGGNTIDAAAHVIPH